jgi:hypothetical protein
MRKIREVLRLKAGDFSKHRNAASLGISATAAMECVQLHPCDTGLRIQTTNSRAVRQARPQARRLLRRRAQTVQYASGQAYIQL